MAIRSVLHTAVSTRDLDASVAWWGAFGFAEVRRWSWPSGTRVVDEVLGVDRSAARAALLEGHGTGIEVFEFAHPDPGHEEPPVHRLGYTHMAFEVDDVDAEVDRLSGLGAQTWAEPVTDGHGARLTYLRSPEGLLVELVQSAGRS